MYTHSHITGFTAKLFARYIKASWLTIFTAFIISPSIVFCGIPGGTGDNDHTETDTQAVIHEAIGLLSRIRAIEAKLLYPAHTELTVYFSISPGITADPRSIRLDIDSRTVASHVYTQREADTLHSGGIQHVYRGYLRPGEHAISVSLDETLEDGSMRRHSLEQSIHKSEKTKAIEIIMGVNSDKRIIIRAFN